MKTLGIIGGLGPETTSEFYLDVIFSCHKKDKNNRPSIIIASVPLPYKIEEDAIAKNTGIERCLPFLLQEAQRLEKAGADFIVLPCNSLHIYIKELRDSIKIPVLSIVEETVRFLKKNDFKKVGIVSTSATIENADFRPSRDADCRTDYDRNPHAHLPAQPTRAVLPFPGQKRGYAFRRRGPACSTCGPAGVKPDRCLLHPG